MRETAVALTALAWLITVGGAVRVGRAGAVVAEWGTWLRVGGVPVTLTFRLDALAALAAVLVATVALLVTVYATAYLRGDPRERRFYGIWLLFVGSMLLLVVADDVIVFFAAWEAIGLCSYLLIGYWFERPGVPRAATQALIVTRLGDLALLLGLLLVALATGTLSLHAAGSLVGTGGAEGAGSPTVLRVAALLVLTGAAAKSAQLPFSAWLPDAMLGPTPVSALLHSATMVAAGVYLVARLAPLFTATGTLPIIAWMGAATALYGAVGALGQRDLKRLLAYSTLSQLGLMFVALGAGSPAAAIALLVAQALFKSLLFLGAGNVQEHAGSLDLYQLGGLARRMPVTTLWFVVGAAVLAGVPVALALPAKDAVLAAAAPRPALLATALLASALTALYITRATVLVFSGGPRSEGAAAARDSQVRMLAPMAALAVLLVLAAPGAPGLGAAVARALGAPLPERTDITLAALAVAALGIAGGVLAARRAARRSARPEEMPPSVRRERAVTSGRAVPRDAGRTDPGQSAVARLAERGLGLARLYAGIAHGGAALARLAHALDASLFGSVAPVVARAGRTIAARIARFDVRRVGAAADRMAALTLALVRHGERFDSARLDRAVEAGARSLGYVAQRTRRGETGRVYNYLAAVVLWSAAALATVGVVFAIRAVVR